MPNEGDVAHLAPAHSVSISSEDHWGREVPSPIVKNCISGDRSFPLGFQTSPRAPNYPSLAASHVVLAWFLIGNITCVVSSAHDGGEQPRKKSPRKLLSPGPLVAVSSSRLLEHDKPRSVDGRPPSTPSDIPTSGSSVLLDSFLTAFQLGLCKDV
ncbi:hypothetical protein CGCF413_v001787 [Colletotrichum fructicola]|nr:hypothetical protein CGCF413_v001787 [Colletotrichum fructicola]